VLREKRVGRQRRKKKKKSIDDDDMVAKVWCGDDCECVP
jgi:hypothetical protein